MASVAGLTPLVLAYVQPTGKELPGLRVTVDKVVHHRDVNFPPETPHAFVYFLTISNLSQETVKLLGRKWIIRSPGRNNRNRRGRRYRRRDPHPPPGREVLLQ